MTLAFLFASAWSAAFAGRYIHLRCPVSAALMLWCSVLNLAHYLMAVAK